MTKPDFLISCFLLPAYSKDWFIMALNEQDELAPYVIQDLELLQLGQEQGSGSYGAVYRVNVSGSVCIAKRLHAILLGQVRDVDVSYTERMAILQRFRKECVLLSKLKHPNIVQFIGVHYGQSPEDLTLVMECLHTDLDKCLKRHVREKCTMLFSLQLSILFDVSNALLYLHSQNPPIIHRDLTASNVLLTENMRGKLADLGVSRVLDLHPMSATAQTVCPGTLGVMPPEALVENPEYDAKLDDFSFGTLTLNVVNHEFAMPFDVQNARRGEVHITRRRRAIEKMGADHFLHDLVISCLQDDPKKRPTTAEICAILKQLMPHPKHVLEMFRQENSELQVQLHQKEAECGELQQQIRQLRQKETQLHQKEAECGELQQQMRQLCQKETQFHQKEAECGELQQQIRQLRQKETQLHQKEAECGELQQQMRQLRQKETQLHQKEAECGELQQQMRQLRQKETQLHQKEAECGELQQQIRQLRQKETQLHQKETQLHQKEAECGELQQQIRQLCQKETQLHQKETQLHQKETQLHQKEAECGELQQQIRQLRQKETQLHQKEAECVELQQQMRQLHQKETQLHQKETQLHQKEAECGELQQQMRQLRQKETQLHQKEAQLRQKEAECEDFQQQIRQLRQKETQLHQKEAQLHQKEAECGELQQQIRQLRQKETQLHQKEAQLHQKEAECGELQQQIRQLRQKETQLYQKEAQLHQKEAECGELQQQIRQLRQKETQLHQKEAECGELQQQIQQLCQKETQLHQEAECGELQQQLRQRQAAATQISYPQQLQQCSPQVQMQWQKTLHQKDEEIAQLMRQWQKTLHQKGQEIVELRKQHQGELVQKDQKIARLQGLHTKQKKDLSQKEQELQRNYEEKLRDAEEQNRRCHETLKLKDQELRTLRKAKSPSHQARKEGAVIIPGQKTHEDLQREYAEYFKKFTRKSGLEKELGPPIMQAAYEKCCQKVLSLFKMELSKLQNVDEESGRKVSDEDWTDQQRVYGLLLHLSHARDQDPSDELCGDIIKELEEHKRFQDQFQEESRKHPEKVHDVVQGATQIAWSMVTLTPPAIVFQPRQYNSQWHDTEDSRLRPWMHNEHFDLIYYRPVLLFGADGDVGYKGSVSNDAHAKGFNPPLTIEDDAEACSTEQEQNSRSQHQPETRQRQATSGDHASAKPDANVHGDRTYMCPKCNKSIGTSMYPYKYKYYHKKCIPRN